nr:hypothetical protein [Mucilaginibacter sp. FT3.2]
MRAMDSDFLECRYGYSPQFWRLRSNMRDIFNAANWLAGVSACSRDAETSGQPIYLLYF